ncbi:hypothetical protein F2Q68_00015317 [Brassica cretica]|uniref:Uncharacterized protein n=1 Tax=Brassica cretica TaxID=69181 RepID=A0A3N6RAV6_BRACR|nr:hypothetical protein F2Q68_00015317 [Brassica cretica]
MNQDQSTSGGGQGGSSNEPIRAAQTPHLDHEGESEPETQEHGQQGADLSEEGEEFNSGSHHQGEQDQGDEESQNEVQEPSTQADPGMAVHLRKREGRGRWMSKASKVHRRFKLIRPFKVKGGTSLIHSVFGQAVKAKHIIFYVPKSHIYDTAGDVQNLAEEPMTFLELGYSTGKRRMSMESTEKDGHIIHVSKDDIRKLMERALRDEHNYICLPEHASSFTHTKLAPEIYTKDEINEMFYGVCGAQ